MSERRTTRAAEEAARTAAAKRTAARRKPAAKAGAKPAPGPSAKSPASAVEAEEPQLRSPLQPPSPDLGRPQDRGLRRAMFLAELAEAKELRKRVAPRRARAAELHARLLRTFRY